MVAAAHGLIGNATAKHMITITHRFDCYAPVSAFESTHAVVHLTIAAAHVLIGLATAQHEIFVTMRSCR